VPLWNNFDIGFFLALAKKWRVGMLAFHLDKVMGIH
jgi:hypothetical protein